MLSKLADVDGSTGATEVVWVVNSPIVRGEEGFTAPITITLKATTITTAHTTINTGLIRKRTLRTCPLENATALKPRYCYRAVYCRRAVHCAALRLVVPTLLAAHLESSSSSQLGG